MIKLNYTKRSLKRREIIVLWSEVWSGKYREVLKPVYDRIKNEYEVTEYREGLVVELPASEVDALDIPEVSYPSKKQVKITEVFKSCLTERITRKAH